MPIRPFLRLDHVTLGARYGRSAHDPVTAIILRNVHQNGIVVLRLVLSLCAPIRHQVHRHFESPRLPASILWHFRPKVSRTQHRPRPGGDDRKIEDFACNGRAIHIVTEVGDFSPIAYRTIGNAFCKVRPQIPVEKSSLCARCVCYPTNHAAPSKPLPRVDCTEAQRRTSVRKGRWALLENTHDCAQTQVVVSQRWHFAIVQCGGNAFAQRI